MARNAELVRQWEILREIDAARTGIPIAKLASTRQVHVRTIRRDLDALCRAGFPLFDDKVNGTSMWKLRAKPFRGLEETGLSILEMCALYFSRSLLQTLGGAPFEEEMNRAFAKLERALPAASRRFLDQLPLLIKTKASGRKKCDDRKSREVLARLLDASLSHRRVDMRYHSASSQRTKDYVIEPLRVSGADGGIYVSAWVPEYRETRPSRWSGSRRWGRETTTSSRGPCRRSRSRTHSACSPAARNRWEIAFDARRAAYVREREWHRSQGIVDGADGAVVLRLNVSHDLAPRAWILSFGASARVMAPAKLAEEIYAEVQAAADRYAPRMPFDPPRPSTRSDRSAPSSLRPGKFEMLRVRPSTNAVMKRRQA